MKITGVLVDMLVELNPELYGPYVVYEKTRKVLYVRVLRAIYGMLEAALLLWYYCILGIWTSESHPYTVPAEHAESPGL
jgi:hypothetical protein